MQPEDIKKNKYGQYFTPEYVADFMLSLATVSKDAKILEPSCGKGVFIDLLHKRGYKNIQAFEIDQHLATQYHCVKHQSFISAKIEDRFDLVIGNPPYIRWANLEDDLKKELQSNNLWQTHFNSLCDYLYIFILKSIELLKPQGQLIFICPEYWMTTKHSLGLRNYIIEHGFFDQIIHFGETPIFDKVTTSSIIFKYVKSKEEEKPLFKVTKILSRKGLNPQILNRDKSDINPNNTFFQPQFRHNERWILANEETRRSLSAFELICHKENTTPNLFDEAPLYHTIGEFCDIGNGLVSGLDEAFQLNGHFLNERESKNVLRVVKAKNLKPFVYTHITKYLHIKQSVKSVEELQEQFPNFHNHLQAYKSNLDKRFQYNRNIEYWEWAFLRNFNLFQRNEKRIFVPCKERISHKDYFRFAIIDRNIFPTQDVTAIFRKNNTKESIEYIAAFLNNPRVFNWLRYNGVIKGNIVEFSEKPLASIPFRAINWNDNLETTIHNQITDWVNEFLITEKNDLLQKINVAFDKLFTQQNDC